MLIIYILIAIILLAGLWAWVVCDRIVWWEWLVGAILLPATALSIHYGMLSGELHDVETVSGHVVSTTHHPYWLERYTTLVCTSTGKTTSCHTQVHYSTHPEYWSVRTSLGSMYHIDQNFHKEIVGEFGPVVAEDDGRSGLVDGDPYIYVSYNKKNTLDYPTNESNYYQNPMKLSGSVRGFRKLKENELKEVHSYPSSNSVFVSNRLLGEAAKSIKINDWDRLNSYLGPKKHVNLIAVGFSSGAEKLCELEESNWLGGKRNDLVICFGGSAKRPDYVKVFGWTDSSYVKSKLSSEIQEHGLVPSSFNHIIETVESAYVWKDFKDFDYITVEPSFGHILVVLLMVCLVAGGWGYIAYVNETNK